MRVLVSSEIEPVRSTGPPQMCAWPECNGVAPWPHTECDDHATGRRKNPRNRGRGGRRRLSSNMRKKVFERDGHQCVRCGEREALTVDHIHPRGMGGSDALVNLQTLCERCHRIKDGNLR